MCKVGQEGVDGGDEGGGERDVKREASTMDSSENTRMWRFVRRDKTPSMPWPVISTFRR